MINYKENKNIDSNKLKELYEDAGWISYTEDIPKLIRAIENSLDVITAWEDNELIGLIRTVGDGETILYIQDILVKKNHKRKGIGTELLNRILDNKKDIRQKVLLTENIEETTKFYEAYGFKKNTSLGLVSFGKFD
ncbi:GNAT family N-acetyltransferase [Oceanirhabdus sp. W0125-5]|uniref:GNAT family N-acetyltransferase n=1 Tax=Oceanirhabdus sp. W0125-5 TaxID=2999116 RepID=UPI0022F33D37|nr:GNAT family N-acetyltransferase [Oceanirhabdus sp. W0125-5]WBW96591.1 GNAT family N-acetyltransferase [Oceanirhabdus sp. W0125-5]